MAVGYLPQLTLPSRVTHNHAPLIDNIFTKTPTDTITEKGILTSDLSDHYPSFIEFKHTNHSHNHTKTKFIKSRLITTETITTLIKDLNKEDWSDVINKENTNDKFNNFILIFTKLMNKNIPNQLIKFNKYKHRISPWITKSIMKSIKYKDKLVNKINKEINKQKKESLTSKLKVYRNILQKVKHQAKSNSWEQKFNTPNSSKKETWKNINTLINRKSEKINLPHQIQTKNKILTNNYDIANALNDHYTKIGQTLSDALNNVKVTTNHNYKKQQPIINSIFLAPTDNNEILNITRGLKNINTQGEDEISQKLLKTTIWSILTPLTNIIYSSLTSGTFQDKLQLA